MHAVGRDAVARDQGVAAEGARHGVLHPQGPRRLCSEPQDGVHQGRRGDRGDRLGRREGVHVTPEEQLGERITLYTMVDEEYVFLS